MSKQAPALQIEQTDIGQQYLIGGVKPVTLKQRLEVLASLTIHPKRACTQKPCDIGLFDGETGQENMDRTHVFLPNARNQKDLFQ